MCTNVVKYTILKLEKFSLSGVTLVYCISMVFTLHWEGGEGGGGQREGTVEGQHSTVHKYIVPPHPWGGNSSQAGSKIQTMSECISSL